MNAKVSRQIGAAIVSALTGLAIMFGIDFSPEVVEMMSTHMEAVIGGVVFFYSIVLTVLRKITSTPMVGWFKREKKPEEF